MTTEHKGPKVEVWSRHVPCRALTQMETEGLLLLGATMSKSPEQRREYQRQYAKNHAAQIRDYKKRYRAEHPEKYIAELKRYRDKHREEIRVREQTRQRKNQASIRARQRERKYGLSKSAFEELFKKQDEACVICQTKEWTGNSPYVDHDHVSGRVRGILCMKCNSALAMIKDNPKTARAMADYLERNK